MSDPTHPPHHGDEPPRYPQTGPGAFGVPPAGPPSQSQPRPQGAPQQPPEYGGPVHGYHPHGLTNEDLTWGGAAHWSALVASLVGGLAFLGPLIVLLVKGNQSAHVRREAVESLNFQISILIYGLVSAVLILALIGIFLLLAVVIAWFVLTIIASVKVSQGQEYRYPFTIRMVS